MDSRQTTHVEDGGMTPLQVIAIVLSYCYVIKFNYCFQIIANYNGQSG